ncbi:MAG: VOC family protein [Steroidobacteraceae bacterium]
MAVLVLVACSKPAAVPSAESAPGAPPALEQAPVVTGGLETVTLITAVPDEVRKFYAAFGLTPLQLSRSEPGPLRAEAALWSVPEEVAATQLLLANSALPGTPRLRVLTVPKDSPAVRDNYSAQADGGASLGFACLPSAQLAGLQPSAQFEVTVPRPDKADSYTVRERYFHAPENVLLPCVTRPADVAPIATLDPTVGVGGPAYAGIVVADVERELRFYRDGLGMEKTRDIELREPELLAAAGLPTDAVVRFVQVSAPGTTSGMLTLLDLGAKGVRNEHQHPPARGLVLWTFPVSDILIARDRVKRAGGVIIAGPLATTTPLFGSFQALTVRTPAGVFLELVAATAQ